MFLVAPHFYSLKDQGFSKTDSVFKMNLEAPLMMTIIDGTIKTTTLERAYADNQSEQYYSPLSKVKVSASM